MRQIAGTSARCCLWLVAGLAPWAAPGTSYASVGEVFAICNDPGLVERDPAIAYNQLADEYLVVWFNDRSTYDDIRAQRLSGDGMLLGGPFYVSAGVDAARRYPDVAFNSVANQYLVVWEQEEGILGTGIHGRRLTGNGVLLDLNDRVIADVNELPSPGRPAIAYSPTANRYLVAWEQVSSTLPATYSIQGRVVTQEGTLDGGLITVTTNATGRVCDHVALAYNLTRDEFLLAWEEYDPAAAIEDIWTRRVTPVGTVLGIPVAAAYFTADTTLPQVAALGDATPDGQYMVTFELHYSATDIDAYGQLMDGFGHPSGGAIVLSNLGEIDEAAPAVAANTGAQRYLTAWGQESPPPFNFQSLVGREVLPNGFTGSKKPLEAGVYAGTTDIAAGADASKDYMLAFEDAPLSLDDGIYGRSWRGLFADGFENGDTAAWSASVP